MLHDQPFTAATNFIERCVVIARPSQANEPGIEVEDLVKLFEAAEGGAEALAEARKWLSSGLEEGRTIRSLRLAAGLSQKQLALASGMKQPNICAIETGKRRPDYVNALKIATVLNIDVPAFYRAYEATK